MKLLKLFIVIIIFITNLYYLSGCLFDIKIKKNKNILILGTSPDYPPYESINNYGKIVGLDIDLAIAISKQINNKLLIKHMSFDSLIIALKQNKIDMIISGFSSTASRRKKIKLIPYQTEKIKEYVLIFWKKLSPYIKNYNDIKNNKHDIFCVQSGTAMSEFLHDFPGIKIKTLDSTTDLLLDIMYNKSKAALVEKNVAVKLKKNQPQLKLLKLSLPNKYWSVGCGIGLKKTNYKLTHKIIKTITRLKKLGFLNKIEKKWFEK